MRARREHGSTTRARTADVDPAPTPADRLDPEAERSCLRAILLLLRYPDLAEEVVTARLDALNRAEKRDRLRVVSDE